jgi:hypothetical protein
MDEEAEGTAARSFEAFRRSFYYGDHADMQFKYLARTTDEVAADAIASVLAAVGETLDTGDLDHLREVAFQAQVDGYRPSEPVTPASEIPFARLPRPLADLTLALVSAGGIYRVDDDPMGPDGPSQQDSLALIDDFLRGTPTLSTIPRDTPNEQLTARHPGYDARSAQRDPAAVFPLDHLRDLASEGRVRLADEHYGFTGATSQRRLEKQVAPRWAEHMAAREVDVVFLVAT